MLLIDIQGKELTQEEVEILSHPLVSGLILFSRNFFDKAQIQALIQDIRQRVKKPLLITIDQEGGRVQRFREGFTQLPAMQSFGTLAENAAEAQAIAYANSIWDGSEKVVATQLWLNFSFTNDRHKLFSVNWEYPRLTISCWYIMLN